MHKKDTQSEAVPGDKLKWQKPRLSQLSIDETQGGTAPLDFDTVAAISSYFDNSGS